LHCKPSHHPLKYSSKIPTSLASPSISSLDISLVISITIISPAAVPAGLYVEYVVTFKSRVVPVTVSGVTATASATTASKISSPSVTPIDSIFQATSPEIAVANQ
jgi:hypothetical protein